MISRLTRAAFTATRALLYLAILALPLCFWDLGTLYLYDFDEAWNAQIAKEMVQSGDWLFLHWRGEPFWDKPPLYFWLTAASFYLFGIGEWQARLPAALSLGASVLLLYLLARNLGSRHLTAWWSALTLLTSIPFLQTGRQAMLDVPLTCCFLLAAWGWREGRAALAAGLGLGGSILMKGAEAGLLLPILALFSLWSRRGPGLKNPYLYAGIVIGLTPVLFWYALQEACYGAAFWQTHWGYHVLRRATEAIEGHSGPWWFYLWELGARFWPWLAILPCALTAGFKHFRRDPVFQMGLVWSACILAAMSVIHTKIPWYLTPVYPGLALLIGGVVAASRSGQTIPGLRPSLALGSLAIAAAALAYGYLLAPPLRMEQLLPWRMVFVPVLVWLALVLGAAALSRHWALLMTGGTYVAGGMLSAVLIMQVPWYNGPARGLAGPWAQLYPDWLPMMRPPDLRLLATSVRRHVPPGAPVHFLYPFPRPSFLFYSDRLEVIVTESDLPGAWSRREVRYVAIPGFSCRTWLSRLPGSTSMDRVGAGQDEYCLLAHLPSTATPPPPGPPPGVGFR